MGGTLYGGPGWLVMINSTMKWRRPLHGGPQKTIVNGVMGSLYMAEKKWVTNSYAIPVINGDKSYNP